MGAVALSLLLCVAPVEIVSEPAGATVVWTRPDSPVTLPGGVTPCRIEVTGPTVGPYTFIVRHEGYRPGYATVDAAELADGPSRRVALAPFELSALPALLTEPELRLPDPDDGLLADRYDYYTELRPTPTGTGAFVYRALSDVGDQERRHEIWWQPAIGAPRRILSWAHGQVQPHSGPWYEQLPRDRFLGEFVYSELDVSPDGRWLVFSRTVDGWCTIEMLQPESRRRQVLAKRDDGILDFPVFAPDGGAVAFTVSEADHPIRWTPAGPGPGRIGVIDLRTAHALKLPAQRAAFSPDGRRLAYASQAAIGIYDLGTRQARIVATGLPNMALQWSPDGRYLSLVHSFGTASLPDGTVGANWLLLLDPDTGRQQRLCTVRDDYAWLPDSQSLLVDELRFDLTGRNLGRWRPEQVPPSSWLGSTHLLGQVIETPAGSFALVTDDDPDGPYDGRLVRRKDGAAVTVAGPYPWPRSLSASADGRRLAAVTGGDSDEHLLLVDASASRTVRFAEPVEQAVLSPDGGCLAVMDRQGRCGVAALDGRVTWSPVRLSRFATPVWLDDTVYRAHESAGSGVGRDGSLVEPLATPLTGDWDPTRWREPQPRDPWRGPSLSFRPLQKGVTP